MAKKNLKKSKADTSLCVFCYKDMRLYDHISGDSDRNNVKLKVCDKFYNLIHLPANNYLLSKKEKSQKDDDDNVEKVAALWNPDKFGICDDCFHGVDMYAKLFEKLEILQRRLRWHLDKLHSVMKDAAKIDRRVKQFQENLNGDKDEESVVKFRKKVYRTCRQKLQADTENKNVTICSKINSSSQNAHHSKYIEADQSQEVDIKPLTFGSGNSLVDDSDYMVKIYDPIPIKIDKTIQQKTKLTSKRVVSRAKRTLPAVDLTGNGNIKEKHGDIIKEEPKKHGDIIKEEPKNEENYEMDIDNEDQGVAVQCKVEITHGSNQEQEELNDCLDSSLTNDKQVPSDCSDADALVRKNWPALQAIIKSLRPHGQFETGPSNPPCPQICKRKRMPAVSKTGKRKSNIAVPTTKCFAVSNSLANSEKKKNIVAEHGSFRRKSKEKR